MLKKSLEDLVMKSFTTIKDYNIITYMNNIMIMG